MNSVHHSFRFNSSNFTMFTQRFITPFSLLRLSPLFVYFNSVLSSSISNPSLAMSANEKFIEMCTRNCNFRHDNPVGENIVFVFDIDDCLYSSVEMQEFEANHVKSSFIALSNRTEDEWNLHSSFNLYRQVFFSLLDMHPSDFCCVYDMPQIDKYLCPDIELINILEKIKIRKFCFTNGSKGRATAILSHLKIDHLFEAIVCADSVETEFICKPMPTAFKFFENYAGILDPKKVYFFDDSKKNITGALECGWNALHVTVTKDIKECIKEVLDKIENN